MAYMMSACGVVCSDCPAYQGTNRGVTHQKRVARDWARIFDLHEPFTNISCGGCLGPEDELFHTSRGCNARRCCLSKEFVSCAECPVQECLDLAKAQSMWDSVPKLAEKLSREDFATYAQPYCGHRGRLNEIRCGLGHPPRS